MMDRDYEGVSYSQEDSFIITIGKYFVHGAAFTILFDLLFGFMSVFLELLFYIGILGIVMFILVYFAIIGTINHGIAGYLWNVESRSNVTSLIGQGLALGLILLIFQFPALLIEVMLWSAPDSVYFTYIIIQFITLSFVSGLVGKQIASSFSDSKGIHTQQSWDSTPTRYQQPWDSTTDRRATVVGIPAYCPSCRAAFPIKQSDLDASGIGRCRMCGFEIVTQGHDPFAEQRAQAASPCPYCGHELPPRHMSDQTGGLVTCTSCGATFKDNRPGTRGSQQPRRTTRDWDW